MNKKIQLDARLTAIMNMVPPGGVVADVGCDHGHLICSLVESDIATRGYACDLNLKPLEKAKITIGENCLSHRIDTVLTDGLTDLPHWLIDTFIIAGMGGDTVARIVLDQPWTRDTRFDFILSPMTKPESLRFLILTNGFIIKKECAVFCDNFVYTVMHVKYTNSTYVFDDITFYTGMLFEDGSLSSQLYLQQVARQLEVRHSGLQKSKDEKNQEAAKKYKNLAEQIRTRLKYHEKV